MQGYAVDPFLQQLGPFKPMNQEQELNIQRIIEISRTFSAEAKIPFTEPPAATKDIIVLESGHQPNFLPYPGMWKKVFLTNYLKQYLGERGYSVLAFFGFLDHDLSTSVYLTENFLPAMKKEGSERIGFKIGKNDKFKSFYTIEKPRPDLWERELDRIEAFYTGILKNCRLDPATVKQRLEELYVLLDSSYADAKTFADVNAFLISRLSSHWLGAEVYFFRYSDLMKEGILAKEWKKILGRRENYIRQFNNSLDTHNVPLQKLRGDHIPFWLHCNCQGKVTLVATHETEASGKCLACHRDYQLDLQEDSWDINTLSRKISPRAVPRNLLMAEAMGTKVFIAGSGGGLKYGLIADDIARSLGFNVPITVSWHSHDLYLGPVQAFAVRELKKTFSLQLMDLLNEHHRGIISRYQEEMNARLMELKNRGENGKLVEKLSCKLYNSSVLLDMVGKIFGMTPSVLDFLVSIDRGEVGRAWAEGLDTAIAERSGDFLYVVKDIIYESDYIPDLGAEDFPVIIQAMQQAGAH